MFRFRKAAERPRDQRTATVAGLTFPEYQKPQAAAFLGAALAELLPEIYTNVDPTSGYVAVIVTLDPSGGWVGGSAIPGLMGNSGPTTIVSHKELQDTWPDGYEATVSFVTDGPAEWNLP